MSFDVLINGFPKTGTHAMAKTFELLGVPAISLHHLYSLDPLPEGKKRMVLMKRDPRNIVISWLRFGKVQITPGMFITHFRKFQSKSVVEGLREFEGWLTDPRAIVVAYEDLIANDREMRRVADYLGVPYLAGAFEALPGLTVTWNVVHSDYRTIWTPDVENVWVSEGGPELLKRWGY